jgi:hypothetical protein
MEPHHQDEHVAEAEMVSRLMANSRSPISIDTPTVANGVWDSREADRVLRPPRLPAEVICEAIGVRSLHND